MKPFARGSKRHGRWMGKTLNVFIATDLSVAEKIR
jgi:hypothetical protein